MEVLWNYRFDRAAAKEKHGKGCTDIDDTGKPWNQAVEFERTGKIKLTVREG